MTCKIIAFVFSIILFGCESCRDDPKPKTELEKLPKATQEGKQTFGCLVDGKAWVTTRYVNVRAYYQNGILSVTAFGNNYNEEIYIRMYTLALSEQKYELPRDNPGHFTAVANFVQLVPKCEHETTWEYPGTVTITHLDRIKFIVSGTFEFEGYSSDCNEAVKITEGRFDLNYAP